MSGNTFARTDPTQSPASGEREHRFDSLPNAIARFDRVCVSWIVARRRPGLDRLFVLGSHTGAMGVPWGFVLTLLRLKARQGDRVPLVRGLAVTIGSWAAARACKRLDRRLRPCQRGEARSLVPCPKSSSLPSDEAACAFGAASYAAARIPHLTVPLYLGAAFTAASRVYVGVHYPSDVVAGALLGVLTGEAFSLPSRRAGRGG